MAVFFFIRLSLTPLKCCGSAFQPKLVLNALTTEVLFERYFSVICSKWLLCRDLVWYVNKYEFHLTVFLNLYTLKLFIKYTLIAVRPSTMCLFHYTWIYSASFSSFDFSNKPGDISSFLRVIHRP